MSGQSPVRDKVTLDLINAGPVMSIREMHQQLSESIKSEWNSIPESIFVQEFLDLFLNGAKDNDERLHKWGIVCGNYHFGVHLLDDETGERVFTVPPVWDTSFINPRANDAGIPSIASHAAQFEMLATARPQIAERYLAKNLVTSLKDKIRQPTSDAWKQYKQLLERYGDKSADGTKPAEQKVQVTYSDDDLL